MRIDNLPTVDTGVLVVGAGPTGLMAGLVLTRRGVPAVVVDHKDGPTRESRALVMHARSMEIYDQLGLVDRVIAGAFATRGMQFGQRAQPIDVASAQRGATPFPGLHMFEQSRNEELLTETLIAAGGDLRFRHRLLDLRTGPDGVQGLLDGPDGLLRVRARWCVGADGASSAVRRQLDVPFEGVTDDATFWVADVHDVSGLPERALAARFGQATFAVAFPLGPHGHVRLISLAPRATVTQDEALASARADLGFSHGTVDWFSTYRVHHRVAARFRVGPVFLAGDAAHVHSPVGGQGMNTGLQDAHNLANLLADVAAGHRGEQALDQYQAERRPVAQNLVMVTDRVFGVIGRTGRWTGRLRRGGSLVGALVYPRLLASALGPRIAGLLGQYRIHYHFGGDGQPWQDDPAVGRRLPPSEQNRGVLRDFSWQLHTYGLSGAPLDRDGMPGWITGPHDFGLDPDGRLRPDRAYLIRPDGFVAAALPIAAGRLAPAALAAALAAQHARLDRTAAATGREPSTPSGVDHRDE